MEAETQELISREIETRLGEIAEIQREQERKEDWEFRALTQPELAVKLQRTNSPYFYAMGWTSGTSGSSGSISYWFANPLTDPNQNFVYVSTYFGVANFLADEGVALSGRYDDWPVLGSERQFLAPGASASVNFSYSVPGSVVRPNTYFINGNLWKNDFFGQGPLFDRAGAYIRLF